MSAAEPAETPTPPVVNATGGAAVIHINKKRAKKRPTSVGRWKRMGDTEPSMSGQQIPRRLDDPVRQLADSFEKSFNARGLTLTDDNTANAYTVTLDLVAKALEGAEVQGIVDPAQREELAALIDGMKVAPGLV